MEQVGDHAKDTQASCCRRGSMVATTATSVQQVLDVTLAVLDGGSSTGQSMIIRGSRQISPDSNFLTFLL